MSNSKIFQGQRITKPGFDSKDSFLGKLISISKIPILIRSTTFWIWLFIIYGITVRLVQYLHNRSLWIDESMLALNIVNRSLLELLKPLDNHQGAPFGFLAVSKFSTMLLGENELALRLFPFITGVLSVYLFYVLAKEYLTPLAVLVAVGLFSIIEPLLYYSAEFKQYSSDAFFTLLILLLFSMLKNKGIYYLNMVIFSLAGSIFIWFSHPSVFVLFSIALVTLFHFLLKHDWKSILKTLIVCSIWLVSFSVFYFISAATLSKNNFMLTYWGKAFMPLLPHSSEDIDWFINAFFDTFSFFSTSFLSGLASVFFLIGVVAVYKQNKGMFFIFVLPIVITLIVSGFYLYPFKGRLTLFLIPSFLLFISAGVINLRELISPRKYITTIAILVLFSLPLYYSRVYLFNPIEKEEIKETLTYLNKHIKPTDNLYLYYGSKYAFDFYKTSFNLSKYNVIVGSSHRNNWNEYIDELNQLKNKKQVWILFSHMYEKTKEKEFFLTYLNTIGNMERFFKATGSEIYLYNFSSGNKSPKTI